MCSAADDPSQHDTPTMRESQSFDNAKVNRACEERVWLHGRYRACGMYIGAIRFEDNEGTVHYACRAHLTSMMNRWAPVPA